MAAWPELACEFGGATVWRARLDASASVEAGLLGRLTPDERVRAGTYRAPDLSRRFVCRRGYLRLLLMAQSGGPRVAVFKVGEHGKPALVEGGLEFSVSSSGDEALFAFSSRSAVGVDIERVDSTFEFGSLLAEHFTADERIVLDGLCDSERLERFFVGWVRKEACAKALGVGLAEDLSRFEVLCGSWPAGLSGGDVPCPDGFVGAVAVVEDAFRPQLRRLPS